MVTKFCLDAGVRAEEGDILSQHGLPNAIGLSSESKSKAMSKHSRSKTLHATRPTATGTKERTDQWGDIENANHRTTLARLNRLEKQQNRTKKRGKRTKKMVVWVVKTLGQMCGNPYKFSQDDETTEEEEEDADESEEDVGGRAGSDDSDESDDGGDEEEDDDE